MPDKNLPQSFQDETHFGPDIELDREHGQFVEQGQWYWVPDKYWDSERQGYVEYEWLGCVTKIGSNFVEIHEPSSPGGGSSYTRVHADNFFEKVRFEPDHERVIEEKVNYHKMMATKHMHEVRAITARLGVAQTARLGVQHDTTGTAVVAGSNDIKAYENALIKAKNEDLPALFKAIETENKNVAKWMSAEALAIKASLGNLEGVIKEIDDRIFNVSLYAGLTENVVTCCDGKPADINEKLRVMQRRMYMDEECLANYKAGGMEFKHIEEFDAWMSIPENRDRLLPFQRCLIAMRVRRSVKHREWDGSIADLFIRFRLEQSDKLTFLYIRNGEQVHRLNCDLEFSDLIFPNKSDFDPSSPMMVRMFCDRVDRMISVYEWEQMIVDDDRRKAENEAWKIANPKETWDEKANGLWSWGMPHSSWSGFNRSEWKPFDSSNVYFDEILETVNEEVKKYNRIAVIIQGLFDRSMILHPHHPVKTWTGEGFNAAIELVYDGAATLHFGEAPDFEAYRAKCNKSLKVGSLVIGQEYYWLKKEGERESRRLDNTYSNRSEYRPETHRPYGNPGPGYITRLKELTRTGTARFMWQRTKQSHRNYGEKANCNLSVPVSNLFNVDAYKLGDFKQFFQDYRTRVEYLQWAPLLLAAEEYHSGTKTIEQLNK